jgi:hypothetical protein
MEAIDALFAPFFSCKSNYFILYFAHFFVLLPTNARENPIFCAFGAPSDWLCRDEICP